MGAVGEEGGALSMTDVNTIGGAHNALNALMVGQGLTHRVRLAL